jgi:hypothetical protein
VLPEPRVHIDKFSGKKHAACKERKQERENLAAGLRLEQLAAEVSEPRMESLQLWGISE